MLVFILIGFIFLLFGMLFLFAPRTIVKLSELGNKLIFTDHGTVAHRKWSGLLLLLMSLIMFYLATI